MTNYDLSIHSNPDARAWAEFFTKTNPDCGVPQDVMEMWFANAMMAMHDWMEGGGPINGDHAQYLADRGTGEDNGWVDGHPPSAELHALAVEASNKVQS